MLETTVKEYKNTFAAKESIHQTSLHRLQTENDSLHDIVLSWRHPSSYLFSHDESHGRDRDIYPCILSLVVQSSFLDFVKYLKN